MPSKGLTTWLYLIATVVALLACKSRRSSPPPAASAAPAVSGPAPTWEVQMPGGYAKNATAASAVGEKLVVATPNSVVVFDRRTGKKSWATDLGAPTHRDIEVAEDVVVVTQTRTGSRDIGVFDLAAGKELWRLATFGGRGFSNAVHTNEGNCSACAVTRRDLRTGKPKWTITAGARAGTFLSKLGPAATGSMIAYPGGPYVMLVSDDRRNEERVYALDAET